MTKSLILKVCLLMAATFICYYSSLSNGLTNWDDQDYATNNPVVKRPSWESVKDVFSNPYYGAYQPLVLLSFAIDRKIGGLNPGFSHFFNLLLHVANTLLVFWLITSLSSDSNLALITALLFGVHPLHVESVTWITERKDVLYAFFFLLSSVAYLYHLKRKSSPGYFLSLLFFGLSAITKGMAVILPVELVLFDYFLGVSGKVKPWLKKVPFFAIAVILGVIAVKAQHPGGIREFGRVATLLDNLLVAGYGFLFYVFKTLVPVNLSAVYPGPVKHQGYLPALYYMAWPAVIVVGFLIYVYARKNKNVLFGALFYTIAILPVIRMLPFGVSIVAADRFAYISSIGLFFIMAAGFAWVFKKAQASGVGWKKLLTGTALAGIVIWWGALTFSRNKVWKDSITLWSDTIKKQPGSALAYNNLGHGYMIRADYGSAIKYCTRAIELDQRYQEAYYTRSCAYKALGLTDRAYDDVCRAIILNPRSQCSYNNRGIIYEETGFYQRALEDYTQAIAIDPYADEPYFNRGNVYQKIGQLERALADYARAIKLNPGYADVYNNRGNVYQLLGQKERALADYNLTIKLNPRHADAHNNRGLLLVSWGQYQQALADFNSAISLNPGNGVYHNNRVDALEKLGRGWEAQSDFNKTQKSERINSNNNKQP
jgi:tetratricopeptide (TPR) repeat protein